MAHEPGGDLVRLRRSSQTHERAHGPPLVRRICLPRLGAIATCTEVGQVAVERARQRLLRQPVRLVHRRHRHCGRCCVEIPQLDRAGEPVDAMPAHRRFVGVDDVPLERVALRLDRTLLAVLAELRGKPGRILVAPQAEQVIPEGVHRLLGVPFVRDRLRQQTAEVGAVAAQVRFRHARGAKRIHVGGGQANARPVPTGEYGIAREAHVFGDQPDELPMRVVLGNRIGTAVIHAAGHPAVLVLKRRVPVDVLAHDVGSAQTEQRGRGERAIADPRATVRTRTRLDGGRVAVDENVGERGSNGPRQHRAVSRQIDLHRAGFAVPPGDGGRELSLECCGTRHRFAARRPGRHRQADVHIAVAARRNRQLVRHEPAGVAELIAHLPATRRNPRAQAIDQIAGMKRHRASGRRTFRQEGEALAVHRDLGSGERQLVHTCSAARCAEKLPRWIHLHRSHGEEQRHSTRLHGPVVDPVTHVHRRCTAGITHGGDLESGVALRPVHRGDGERSPLQGVARCHVAPPEQAAARVQKRLERWSRAAWLDRTVLGYERLVAAVRRSDDRPVELLTEQIARPVTARRRARDGLEEVVGRCRPLERMNLQVPQGDRLVRI